MPCRYTPIDARNVDTVSKRSKVSVRSLKQYVPNVKACWNAR
jgi:hypothetical protein